jgi:hypothetical protein
MRIIEKKETPTTLVRNTLPGRPYRIPNNRGIWMALSAMEGDEKDDYVLFQRMGESGVVSLPGNEPCQFVHGAFVEGYSGEAE